MCNTSCRPRGPYKKSHVNIMSIGLRNDHAANAKQLDAMVFQFYQSQPKTFTQSSAAIAQPSADTASAQPRAIPSPAASAASDAITVQASLVAPFDTCVNSFTTAVCRLSSNQQPLLQHQLCQLPLRLSTLWIRWNSQSKHTYLKTKQSCHSQSGICVFLFA